MPYNRCKQCKTRLGNLDTHEFCSVECDGIYSSSEEVFCKTCNKFLGKSSVIRKQFCNILCSNKHQTAKNTVSRVCVFCNSVFWGMKSSKRKLLCSIKCEKEYAASSSRNEKRMESLVKSNLKKYGVEHVFSLKSVIDNSKKTKMEIYGNLNNFEKIKNTKMEKYGNEFFCNSDKSIFTKKEKYGSLNFNEKSNKTKMEKYGTLDFSIKANDTKRKKYGNLSKYLTDSSYKRLLEKYGSSVEFCFTENDFTGTVDYVEYDFKCKICETKFRDNMSNGIAPRCLKCFPTNNNVSIGEKELLEFVRSIYAGKVIENDRKILEGKELDIYLPDENIALEYNGVYWHGEVTGGKTRKYHVEKTHLSESLGLRLIHVLDYEWNSSKEIVKSIIQNMLGKSDSIFARKCEIRDVSVEDKREFLIQNHIQGDDKSSVRYGLYLDDELVSLMTFSKSRFSKKYEYELLRFCNKLNLKVVGGAGKMFKFFLRSPHSPKSIVTYSDRRLFSGALYEAIGMNLGGVTEPGYHYFDITKSIPLNRMAFQKHKLGGILKEFDVNLSEWENLKKNGYDRIWDCGHFRYVWNKNELYTSPI